MVTSAAITLIRTSIKYYWLFVATQHTSSHIYTLAYISFKQMWITGIKVKHNDIEQYIHIHMGTTVWL